MQEWGYIFVFLYDTFLLNLVLNKINYGINTKKEYMALKYIIISLTDTILKTFAVTGLHAV